MGREGSINSFSYYHHFFPTTFLMAFVLFFIGMVEHWEEWSIEKGGSIDYPSIFSQHHPFLLL